MKNEALVTFVVIHIIVTQPINNQHIIKLGAM
jgi:hypothetical protein